MNDNAGEKERICPSCRTSISVLATKCRFCGETVGKPKEETRELSVSDLGGETIQHRAPSGSIIEALESFRIEGKQGDEELEVAPESPVDDMGMATLDSLGEDYMESSFGGEATTSAMAPQKPKPPTLQDRLGTVVKFVVPIIILIIAVVKVPAYFKDRAEIEKSQVSVFHNQAPGILASGGPPIDALSASLEAMEHDSGAANTKILEDSLNAVVANVNDLLNAIDWDIEKIQSASGIASRATEMYPNDTTTKLKKEVDQESIDYRMLLIKIDGETGDVTFKMNDPAKPNQVVKKDDMVSGRFRITSIVGRRSVKLVDEKRKNRSLVCELGQSPR